MDKTELQSKINELRYGSNRTELINQIKCDSTLIKYLVELSVSDHQYPIPDYASWTMSNMVKKNPELFQKHYKLLVDCAFNSKNQTVLRNVVNSITYLKITDYRESNFIDLLISNINDSNNKVALQVYSIYVLVQFIEKYPELKTEIEEVILLNEKGKTPAYFAAKKNFYKKTEKI